jgi:alpha-N-acetylglucosaminidase
MKTLLAVGLMTLAWIAAGETVLRGEPARATQAESQRVPPEPESPTVAVGGLIQRLLPGQARHFQTELIPKDPNGDVFELETRDGRVILRGNNGVSLASALNWYLKHYCQAHVSWCGDQLNLPKPLPSVPERVRRVSPFKHRYCFNYCAFSYSLAWWDWRQWERMLDWMALHGINLPLSVTGQEAVWQQVTRQLGLSDRELKEFLVGPGFLPFGWMGCLDGWCGPLPDTWIRKRADLERRILARERAFGMTPVLQGFTGHVPPGVTNRFPGARLQRLPSWAGFAPTHFVDPQDALFTRLGKLFIEEQTRQFGTDHLYAADTFIEMQPPSSDPKFLADMGRAVFEAMRAADPEAIWVLQGWLFVNNPSFWQPPQGRALLGAVPAERLLVLDLFCESTPAWSQTEAFYGKPWVWCIIQNFGGTVSLHGALPRMAADLSRAMTDPHGGKLSGIGLIFEGLDYNPIVQDFVTDMTWRNEVPKLEQWADGFARRRYGRLPPATAAAWEILRKTAYTQVGRTDPIFCHRPTLSAAGGTGYDPDALFGAWEKLLVDAPGLRRLDTYQFDVVNVAREALGSLGQSFHARVATAIHQKDPKAFDRASREFLELISDLDELVGTRREFLLGRWLADAKHWAGNNSERRLYEWNARNIITLWGPPESVLHEYSLRQWAGMFNGFYRARWQQFFERHRAALAANRAFDQPKFDADIRAWEDTWTRQTDRHRATPRGDPVTVAQRLLAKYRPASAPESRSLTTGKPASCSHALPNCPAWLANDGRRLNTDRYWATDVTVSKEAWWQVDLEQPATVGRVVVVSYYGDERYYGFTVEVSLDGQTWDQVADRCDNTRRSTSDGYVCEFPPRPVRYLRVNQTHNSANTGRHLVEVMAYEN